jgi:hypothetical protein
MMAANPRLIFNIIEVIGITTIILAVALIAYVVFFA